MNDSQIIDVIARYILERYLPGEDPSTLTPTTSLIRGGVLDSLSVLDLIGFLEQHFEIRLEATDVDSERLDTLSGIADLVQEKLRQQ